MKVNGKIIYRSALDQQFYVQGEDLNFESIESAIWYCETEKILTYEEVIMAQQKLELAKAIVYQTQKQASVMDEAPDILQWYFDSGVAFTDEDVAQLGITASDISACLTLLENLKKFYNGNSPTNAIYRSTVNSVRKVNTQ